MSLHLCSIVCFLTVGISVSAADPCNVRNGGCDPRTGMCWGTGEDTHYCTCQAGFKQDLTASSHLCIDIDECVEEDPCDKNARCQNTFGSYRCNCKCGYVLDYTRQHCLEASEITGMCALPSRCHHHQERLRFWFKPVPFSTKNAKDYMPDYSSSGAMRRLSRLTLKKRECECEDGFAFNKCNLCEDVNECVRAYTLCKGPRSSCVNTEGGYYCECGLPYVLGPCKERCYHPRSVPELCRQPRTKIFNREGFKFRTKASPHVLHNYAGCDRVEEGKDYAIDRFDVDFDGDTDVLLRWYCDDSERIPTSTLKSYAEEEARWGPWTCWTACKVTCWGGLQTRSRKCLHGLPGLEGCSGVGSQKKSCYNGVKCGFRTRKDVETLTPADIYDLTQALKRYKNDPTSKGFHNAASAHGWPFQCNRQSCCRHGAKLKFLTWHRSMLLNFEEGLSRYLVNKSLGIPYWNWLRQDVRPPKWTLNKFLYGEENPWAKTIVLVDREGPMRTTHRDDAVVEEPIERAKFLWVHVAAKKKRPHIMHEFSESLENAHGGPHVSVCQRISFFDDKCAISLASLDFAGFDPLFMLHHAQVDRLWAVSQKEMADRGLTTWTTQTALEALEENGDFGRRFEPFSNLSLNSFPNVQATNTMRDAYYYEELTGIRYDSLEKDGLPRSTQRILRPGGDERLFIGHYLRQMAQNFHMNYYMLFDEFEPADCSSMTEDRRLGSASRLGLSKHAKGFKLSTPQLIPMEKVGVNTFGLDFDFVVKVCYTVNSTCKERCPELSTNATLAQPDPMLLLYVRNQPVDIYKFRWSEGWRVPHWLINMNAGSHWLYLHGNRSESVMQVQSSTEYIECDASRGRPFPCGSGKPCILPVGVYYLVDFDYVHCKAGLKMFIVSSK